MATPLATVYGLFDPRNADLRYVGYTTKPLSVRLREHVSWSAKREKSHKAKWIKSLVLLGLEPEIDAIETHAARADAESAEMFWIAYFRSIGAALTNATAGGEGLLGLVRTPEHCAAISRAKKGQPLSEATRAAQCAAVVGRKASPETRARLSAEVRARGPEWREKLRTAQSGRWTPEERARHAEITRLVVWPKRRAAKAAA